MKKLRVFQTVKKKRIVSPGTILLLLLFIPYIITFLFGNLKEGSQMEAVEAVRMGSGNTEEGIYICNVTALGEERIPLEIYVADKLARSIDNSYEMEALKAQAVLIRSGLLAEREEDAGSRVIYVEDKEYGSLPVSDRIRQAAAETCGVCLMWEERPAGGAYFAVSNGATRNGEELFLTDYPYLKSVVCSRDFLSDNFISRADCEVSEFERIWQQIPGIRLSEEEREKKEKIIPENEIEGLKVYRDSVGYVLYVEKEEKCVAGEDFRKAFLLASAGFHISQEKARIIFTVKGAGHGLGMSQFAANEMAGNEEDYVDILKYFFEDVTISKFE